MASSIDQSTVPNEYQDRVALMLSAVLRKGVEVWTGPESDYPSTSDITEKIRHAFKGLLTRLTEPDMAAVGVDASEIDLVAVEVSRALIPISHGEPEEPNVRVFIGELGDYFKSDPYKGDRNPFLDWRDDVHLRLRLFADEEALSGFVRKQEGMFGTFVTTIGALEAVNREDLPLRVAVEHLLARQPPFLTGPEFFKEKGQLREAAQVALRSTENSRALMHGDFREPLSPLTGDEMKELRRLGYPFRERNILYVPVFIAGQPIGGAVFHSKEPLHGLTVSVIDLVLHLLLYRIRSGDEISAARLASADKARWEATLLYVHRLAHDVQTPLRRARELLSDIIKENNSSLSELANASLIQLSSNLANLDGIIAGGAGIESVDKLREQAHRDARPDRLAELVEDSLWIWRLEAQKHGKTIELSVPPDTKVTVPRFLVVEVLENLVANAVRFARQTVRVSVEQDHDVPSKLTFIVSDDGGEVSTQVRSDYFVPHYAADAEHKGLGLQLSEFIVTKLLDGSGPKVEPGPDGWTVSFEIPEVLTI